MEKKRKSGFERQREKDKKIREKIGEDCVKLNSFFKTIEKNKSSNEICTPGSFTIIFNPYSKCKNMYKAYSV